MFNNKIKYNYSKVFGLFLSSVGFIVFGLSIFNNYVITSEITFVHPLNIITLLVSVIVLVSSFTNQAHLAQVICLSITSVLTIYNNPEQSFAVLQIILVVIISYKNGFLFENLIKKLLIAIFIIVTTILLSLKINSISILRIIPTLLFFLIFIISLLIILKDELNKYIAEIKNYKKIIAVLNIKLKKSLQENEFHNKKKLNPNDFNLTPKEFSILKSLCLYRETNKELAYRHSKSVNTIKVQITQILIKVKLRDRYEIIEYFSNYFILQNDTK